MFVCVCVCVCAPPPSSLSVVFLSSQVLRGLVEGVTVRALLHTSRTMRTLLTPGHYSETFEAMDTDHDGHIDRDEFRSFVVGVTEQDAHERMLKRTSVRLIRYGVTTCETSMFLGSVLEYVRSID